MTATIVFRKFATYKELQTFYSFSDALDLLEVMQVNDYNRWLVEDRQKK